MPGTSFPVVSGAQIVSMGDSSAKHPPGTIMAFRNTVNDAWSLIEYVRNGNTVINQGEVAVRNLATLQAAGVTQSAVSGDGKQPTFAGIACATIGSLSFGWIYINGYVEKADLSHTAAAGELLAISGSTAGKLTPDGASSLLNG